MSKIIRNKKKKIIVPVFRNIHSNYEFKTDDKVLIIRKSGTREGGWAYNWTPRMSPTVNSAHTIRRIHVIGGYELGIDNCYYPSFCLRKIPNNIPIEDGRIKRGDKVKVLYKAESNKYSWGASWAEEMNKSIGKIFRVRSINSLATGVLLDTKSKLGVSQDFYYPLHCLQKIYNQKKE